MKKNQITIFTDGASKGNPGSGGWAAIIMDNEKVKEIGGYEEMTTNNRMEMKASISALQTIMKTRSKSLPVSIYTDSSYLKNGAGKWIYAWAKNDWLTKSKEKMANVDLWKNIYSLMNDIAISWVYVPGHLGIISNERADFIASSFAQKKKVNLFNGLKKNYKFIGGLELSKINRGKSISKAKNKKSKAYSYVSLVEGEIKIHHSWEDCKSRVIGKRNAKFRKTLNEQDQKQFIESLNKNNLGKEQ